MMRRPWRGEVIVNHAGRVSGICSVARAVSLLSIHGSH